MQDTVLPPPSVAGVMSAAKYLHSPLRLVLVQAPVGSSVLKLFANFCFNCKKNEEVYLSC